MSTIKIFSTKITPSRNAAVDEIQTYLNSLTPTYESNSFQYLPIALDKTIKINASQAQLTHVGNYLSLYQDGRYYYFFIVSSDWKSESTLSLELSLDTINTFKEKFTFSPKTRIIREHKDRFKLISKSGTILTLLPLVDDIDEGISGAIQYRNLVLPINDEGDLGRKWYLVYKTPTTPTAAAPIQTLLVPDTSIVTDAIYNAASATLGLDTMFRNYIYTIKDAGVEFEKGSFISGTITGNTLGIAVSITENNEIKLILKQATGDTEYTGTDPVIIKGTCNVTVANVSGNTLGSFRLAAASGDNISILGLDSLDLTDSTLVKIIECPYMPIEKLDENVIATKLVGFCYPLDNKQELSNKIVDSVAMISNVTYNTTTTKRTLTDPKLYNSSFYTFKITYDSYSKPITLEKLAYTTQPRYSLTYKQSNNLSSNCGFKFTTNAVYYETEDFGEWLISTRNNEKSIYTNNYLDYMRTGYNFDRKAQTRSNIGTWLGTATSLIGAAISTAVAIPTGGLSIVAAASLGTNAITSIANSITTTIANEQSIQQKQNESLNQATPVNVIDDLNLLNAYCDNKVEEIHYSVSSALRKQLDDLFYYCGYACNYQEMPKIHTRKWFNYLQCDAVFDERADSIMNNYLDDIKARLSAGVTWYHYNGSWDWDQVNENVENW